MKKYILVLLMAIFAQTVGATQLEFSDRKPGKSQKHKKHKKSRKKSRTAKKHGLVGRGCRGLKAHPNFR